MPRTVPVSLTEVPGNFITSAWQNAQVKALNDFLAGSGTNGVPRFKGYASTGQSIATGSASDVAVTLDTEDYDSDNGHSTVTNSSRYTVQVAGVYLIMATASFPTNSTGNRKLGININGTNARGGVFQGPAMASNSWSACVSVEQALVVGDYIEMAVWQTSGGPLSLNAGGGGFGPTLMCHWISS
ncbi:hypothetical protein [Streptomyces griseorubiginosus]|uniref:hypothetical protein n=1 Tax=Streptomyces griseorubiginosus TaxID=67304 RepID=UPI0033E0E17C